MKNKLANCKTLKYVQRDGRKGFTLIELLVVVLIIGILAAIAVPQYQKAVWRSRNTQLKTLIKSVAEAEQRYFMANGEYTKTFTELDLDLPLSAGGKACDVGHREGDSLRGNSSFVIVLNNHYGDTPVGSVVGVWRTGKYGCAGFIYSLSSGKWRCLEMSPYTAQEGEFCKQIEKGTFSSSDGNRYYNLP